MAPKAAMAANRDFPLKNLVSGGFFLIGIYASIRYGGERAYALGKFVGAA